MTIPIRHTRGGLEPARIVKLNDQGGIVASEAVDFMFNPHEFSIAKTNNWTSNKRDGKNVPEVTFSHGESATVTLVLHFDTQPMKGDVRHYTNKLWDFMLVDPNNPSPNLRKTRPPTVAFQWGKLFFKAVITQMTQKFTLFNEKGTPLRCEVTLQLKQYADDNDTDQTQVPGMGTGGNLEPLVPMVEGQRADNLLSSKPGSSKDSYPNIRELAEKNGIDDPLNIPVGKLLKL